MDTQDLEREFARFDTNKNGKIDENEFADLLRKLRITFSDDMTHTAFLAIDVNGNGVIDFGEFCAWYGKQNR